MVRALCSLQVGNEANHPYFITLKGGAPERDFCKTSCFVSMKARFGCHRQQYGLFPVRTIPSPIQLLVSVVPGAVIGATVTLVGSYLVGVQRKYEVVLNELVEEDMRAAWSNPTRNMHEAAEMVQRRFR